jgi:hypothetical protein
MDLPHAYRWEVTRRHPYYLRLWELAQRFYEGPSNEIMQRALEKLAAVILRGALGVTAAPPPPGASAESLGLGNLGAAWEKGAVAPMTIRGLLGMAMTDLPPELLVRVGQLFIRCGERLKPEEGKPLAFVSELSSLKEPVLDSLPARPLLSINLHAPLRAITEGVEATVGQWKTEQGIGERRRRDDKLEDYLAVWDRREGWVNDHYDITKELTLREIAQQLRIPLPTAANRYRSAFRLIVGHDYAPSLWAQLIGAPKLLVCFGTDDRPRRTLRRPWADRQPRAVPEAALQPPGDSSEGTGMLNTFGTNDLERDYANLLSDIQKMIAEGHSNAEIKTALEMTSSEAEAAIEYLRQRHLDRL